MSVEIEAHEVSDFKAPIYGITDYEGLEHAGVAASPSPDHARPDSG